MQTSSAGAVSKYIIRAMEKAFAKADSLGRQPADCDTEQLDLVLKLCRPLKVDGQLILEATTVDEFHRYQQLSIDSSGMRGPLSFLQFHGLLTTERLLGSSPAFVDYCETVMVSIYPQIEPRATYISGLEGPGVHQWSWCVHAENLRDHGYVVAEAAHIEQARCAFEVGMRLTRVIGSSFFGRCDGLECTVGHVSEVTGRLFAGENTEIDPVPLIAWLGSICAENAYPVGSESLRMCYHVAIRLLKAIARHPNKTICGKLGCAVGALVEGLRHDHRPGDKLAILFRSLLEIIKKRLFVPVRPGYGVVVPEDADIVATCNVIDELVRARCSASQAVSALIHAQCYDAQRKTRRDNWFLSVMAHMDQVHAIDWDAYLGESDTLVTRLSRSSLFRELTASVKGRVRSLQCQAASVIATARLPFTDLLPRSMVLFVLEHREDHVEE